MTTNTILKIAMLCVICAAMMISGCLDSGYETTEDDEYVFVAQTPRIPAATPTHSDSYYRLVEPTSEYNKNSISSPKYTKIWCMVSASFYVYDADGNFLGTDSFSNEVTAPYTEYDWTDDSTTIEDVVDAMGFPYNYVETISEKSSYPATEKYIMQGKYVIHCDNGLVTMTMTCTATRY